MTKISTIYDAIVTEVAAALGSEYKRFSNAYRPEQNNELLLEKGYGIAFGNGTNTNRELCKSLWSGQEILVVLVNQSYTTDHDIDGEATEEKSLMEDYIKVAKAIESNPDLSDSTVTLQTGHDGIAILDVDPNVGGPKYRVLTIFITTEFRESLS